MSKRADYDDDDDDLTAISIEHYDDEDEVPSSPLTTKTETPYVCSIMQVYAKKDKVAQIVHPRDATITWTVTDLVDVGVHEDMKAWFDKNVTCYMRNRRFWPSRVSPKRFLLNYGRSGSGRTTALVTLCAENRVNILMIKGNVRHPNYLVDAYRQAQENQPCVVYFENDYRVTSDSKESRAVRKQLYAAYTRYVNIRTDDVWTVIASSKHPQKFLNGSDDFVRYFAENGNAVYTPVLTKHTVLKEIITHILHDYTGNSEFQRPSDKWSTVIDRLATYAIYHTIKEIHTFIDDVFCTHMHSIAHKLSGKAADRTADTQLAMPRPDIFSERFNSLPSVDDTHCLSPWRRPYSDYVDANAEWDSYTKAIKPTKKLTQSSSSSSSMAYEPSMAFPLASPHQARRDFERQRRQRELESSSEYSITSPTSPVMSSAYSPLPPSPETASYYASSAAYLPQLPAFPIASSLTSSQTMSKDRKHYETPSSVPAMRTSPSLPSSTHFLPSTRLTNGRQQQQRPPISFNS